MFGCSKCNKQFSFRSALNRHHRIVHDDDEGVKYEPMTPNNAANRGVRRAEVVSGDAKFQCQDCERTFSGHSGLRHHTKSKHEGIKYACNQCDYQATRQDHLKTHIQSKHEGVKYACKQCDYQATQQGSLTVHIQSIHLFICCIWGWKV